ncbi:MAG: hypothetical protein GSR82_02470 [Desulfurococcales archaeon]|nr:hypothetical protein [Desulfurococcales archaeon]
MYIEPLTVLENRLNDLVLELADRYSVPYSIVRDRCKSFINSLLKCWIISLDWSEECRLEKELLEECVEELGDSYG